MQGKRAMWLTGVGALAALTVGVPAQAQAQSARVAVWADRTGFDDYDWIDRADAISDAIGEAPPDTSFAFENGEPWAWTMEDGTTLIVEQLPDGPHGYYFEPGTDAPFLVRDPSMSFGFIDGAVAVVYGADGGVLSRNDGRGWLGAAMRGFDRGKLLKRAMVRRDRWRNVNVSRWYDMSYLLFDWWDDWDYGLSRNPAWRRHHEGPRGIGHRRHWDGERHRRELISDAFQRWGQNGYRGPAPGRFTPPRPGTQPPPHRWDGRGDGRRGDGPGHGLRRPRTDLDPQVRTGVQPDVGVTPPQPDGGLRGAGRPRRDGGAWQPNGPSGQFRPRPEPQAPQAAPVPQTPPPVAVVPDQVPSVDRPLPRPRPDRGGDWRGNGGPARTPRSMEAPDVTEAPPQPNYGRPAEIRVRPAPPIERNEDRPSYTPPSPSPAFQPRPERSFTPPPTPAPAPSYTPPPAPAPSYTPAPAPTRTYTPSPAPAPARSTPSTEPSRQDRPAVRPNED